MTSNYALAILRILSDGKKHSLNALSELIDSNKDYVIHVIKTKLSNFQIILTSNICQWTDPIIFLSKELILSYSQLAHGKFEIIVLDEIDSTNNYLKALLKKN